MEGLKPLVIKKYTEFYQACVRAGLEIRVTETYRSIDRQNQLWKQGRVTPGNIVTNAKGGQSFHNYGVAFDCYICVNGYMDTNVSRPDLWEKMGQIGESVGFEWGGRWTDPKDLPHFQLTFGHTWQEFMDNKVDYSIYNIVNSPKDIIAPPIVQPIDKGPLPQEVQNILNKSNDTSWKRRFLDALNRILGTKY